MAPLKSWAWERSEKPRTVLSEVSFYRRLRDARKAATARDHLRGASESQQFTAGGEHEGPARAKGVGNFETTLSQETFTDSTAMAAPI